MAALDWIGVGGLLAAMLFGKFAIVFLTANLMRLPLRVLEAVREAVDGQVALPPGYALNYSGQYEYLERDRARLIEALAAEPFQLADGAGGNHLEHALAGAAHRLGDRHQLVDRRERSRHRRAVRTCRLHRRKQRN